MQEEEILRRIAKLDQHLINLIIPIQQISECLRSPNDIKYLIEALNKPILIDDKKLRELISQFTITMNNFSKNVIQEFREDMKSLDLSQTMAEIKFIGKRLNDIEITLKKIQEEGIKKNIQLDFRCDGYELVKKPVMYKKEDPIENPNTVIDKLLSKLLPREVQILIHRLGLFGQKSKIYKDIGNMFNVSGERALQIYRKAIRKLRHPSLRDLVDKIKDIDLKKAILND